MRCAENKNARYLSVNFLFFLFWTCELSQVTRVDQRVKPPASGFFSAKSGVYAPTQWPRFRAYDGDWVALRKMIPREVDLHFGKRAPDKPYWEAMDDVSTLVLSELKSASKDAMPYVLFLHGASTSVGWHRTTARSVVRGIMRSPASTPYIIRGECLQHETAFLALIRVG
jgi:hypothetical protein